MIESQTNISILFFFNNLRSNGQEISIVLSRLSIKIGLNGYKNNNGLNTSSNDLLNKLIINTFIFHLKIKLTKFKPHNYQSYPNQSAFSIHTSTKHKTYISNLSL